MVSKMRKFACYSNKFSWAFVSDARNMEYAGSHHRILNPSGHVIKHAHSNYAFWMICLDDINKINAARVHNLGRKWEHLQENESIQKITGQ